MVLEDLNNLYIAYNDSDDIPVNEMNSAIAAYAEENDLLFTEVLENLYHDFAKLRGFKLK